LACACAVLTGTTPAAVAHVPRPDFNGDGFDDLAIAAPNEDVGGAINAGAVHVLYGSASGIQTFDSQRWTQNSNDVPDVAEDFDRFGSSLAWGDFNGDGFSDLAIGAPQEDVGTVPHAGCVIVIYGSVGGLRADQPGLNGDAQLFTQNTSGMLDTAESNDQFGWALASGDFDGDERDDLAIGVIGQDIATSTILAPDAGAVHVLYGSPTGLSSFGDEIWTQNSAGVPSTAQPGESFGFALAIGDFDGNGFDDLAIGAPGEDVSLSNGMGVAPNAGAVNVIYGSQSGLNGAGAQVWSQESPGIEGISGPGDSFGFSLTAGDFDGDGRDDLAIGSPNKDFSPLFDVGIVSVILGTNVGLRSTGDFVLGGFVPAQDDFGFALASGDFNHDGRDDLAASAPRQDVASFSSAGAVFVFSGSSHGLPDGTVHRWTQDSEGILDRAETDDRFGESLWIGDFNGDGFVDLAIGSPRENIGVIGNAGAVNLIYGTDHGLRQSGDQFITPNTPGVQGSVEFGGFFGWRVTVTP